MNSKHVCIAVVLLTLLILAGGCSLDGSWDVIARQNGGGVDLPDDLWADVLWTQRMRLVFSENKAGEDLTDFPVLVVLNSSRIDYSTMKDSGGSPGNPPDDLRFFDAGDGGSELYYEIEKWDPTGTSYLWVKVPQVNVNSTTDYIWLYWSNGAASVTSYRDAAEVWSDYELVYHFDSLLSGNRVLNSCTGDTNGVVNGVAGGPIETANIGNGFRTKHGSAANKQYVDTNYHPPTAPEAWTIECWVEGDDAPAIGTANGPIKGDYFYNFEWNHSTNPGGIVYRYTSGWQQTLTLGGTSLLAGTSYYLAGVYSLVEQAVHGYRNGVLIDSDTGLTGTLSTRTPSILDVFIGTEANTNSVMEGLVDEVRIANVAHSAAWIQAQYWSMTDDLIDYQGAETVH